MNMLGENFKTIPQGSYISLDPIAKDVGAKYLKKS